MLDGRRKGRFGSSVDFHTDANRSGRRLMHFTCWMFCLKPSHAIIASWGNRVWMVHQIRCSNNNGTAISSGLKRKREAKNGWPKCAQPIAMCCIKTGAVEKGPLMPHFHSSRMSVVFMWYKGVQQIKLSGYMHCKDFWEMHNLSKCNLPKK